MNQAATRTSRNSQKLPWLNIKFLIAGIVLAGAVGYLMYTGVQGTSASYFVTVSELEQQNGFAPGERLRVGGDVLEGSIVTDSLSDPLKFEVTDGVSSFPVVYHEVVPDIFNDHVEVVVEGEFNADGVFEADSVLTKCPSRFEEETE